MKTQMPYDSLEVMRYIVKRAYELGIQGMNITKAQKLMYCCYGVLLAKCNYRISNETPEAWQYGPIFPRTLRIMQAQRYPAFLENALNMSVDLALSEEQKKIIDATIGFFGQFSASKLSAWSHIVGSPWSIASNNGEFLREQMDDEGIKKYFKDEVLG